MKLKYLQLGIKTSHEQFIHFKFVQNNRKLKKKDDKTCDK